MGRESNGFEGAKRPFGRERSEPSCPGPGRESNGFEGAKRPFGRERSELSCPGPGSAERSAAERGPNSSFLIFWTPSY